MLRPLLLLCLAALSACASTRADTATTAPAPAAKFAMRAYQVVILRRGPAWSPAQTPETQALFAGHMAHLQRQTAAGLCVFAVDTAEEARALAGQDPAVQAGRFTVDVLPWYGPAGLRYDGMDDFVANGPPPPSQPQR
jgi:hypothetical protein